MFSDAFPHKKVNDYIYEVYGRNERKTETFDDRLIGGNKSAEGDGEEEAVDATTIAGLDIVNNFKLQEWGFENKKKYQKFMKDYMKQLTEYLVKEGKPESEVDAFKKGFAEAFKGLMANYDDYCFWIGEKHYAEDEEASEGMVVLQRWDNVEKSPEYPDGLKATFFYIAHGLYDEKF